MLTLFDQEEVTRLYLYNYGEEKKAEGEARGRTAGKLEGALCVWQCHY